jgi:hypothetical protein
MRRAAEAAGVSHTWWDLVERGAQRRHDKAREAVARAFDWPLDWPENPPPPPVISQRDDAVLAAFERLASTMLATMAAMQTQIDELQQAVDRLAPAKR